MRRDCRHHHTYIQSLTLLPATFPDERADERARLNAVAEDMRVDGYHLGLTNS
jgi:hypothetical protein